MRLTLTPLLLYIQLGVRLRQVDGEFRHSIASWLEIFEAQGVELANERKVLPRTVALK